MDPYTKCAVGFLVTLQRSQVVQLSLSSAGYELAVKAAGHQASRTVVLLPRGVLLLFGT